MADMDAASLHKLRVVDLKEILVQKGLSTSGLKAELVKRLRDAMSNETSESPTEGQPADGGDNMMQENISSDSEQLIESQEREEQIDLERQRSEDAHRRMAEEHQRRMAEERQERLAAEERERQVRLEQEKVFEERRILAEEEKRKELHRIEEARRVEEQRLYEEEQRRKGEQERIEEERQKEQQRLYAEERRKEEQRLFEQEARRKEGQRLYEQEMRRREEQRLYEEEERRKQEQRLYEEEERRKEERRMYLEEERRKEEQRLHAEDERRKEEQRKFQEAEKQRQQEEEKRKQAEMAKHQQLIHQQKLLAEKEKIRLAEEQQRLLAEEQKRLMAEEQQRLLAEQKRLMAEEQQRLLAEEQQRILAEQQQKLLAEQQQKRMAEQQQKLMAEQQQKLLAEQQQKRLAEQQQKRLAEQQQKRLAEQQKLLAEQQQKFLGEQQQKMLAHQLAPPGLHPTTMPPPPLQQFSQPPPALPTSVVTTAMTNAFAPPPPPPPAVMNNQATGKESSDITDKLESKNENQVSANKDSNADQPEEIQLPHAVEKILALKNERAQQLGIDPDTAVVVEAAVVLKESVPKKTVSRGLVSVDEIEDEELEEEETSTKVKESRSRRRKKKKKQKRSARDNRPQNTTKEKNETAKKDDVDIDIEYVQDTLDPADPLYSQFVGVFERFKLTDVDKEKANADVLMEEAKQEPKIANKKKPMDMDDDDDDDDDDGDDDKKDDDDKPKLSRRKLKKLSRMTVAELKQKVSRPELVEMHDVTAKDPVLLLHLKASRNTVPVPRHWCFKRKYLQGKRGIEKPAFELPDFIKRTGIMEMRQSLQEKEDQKTMKAKMRERVRPKLGKIDIDYQKLHDAFFKWQTKPKMTIHGDLYYEGKEFETRLKEKKPGDLNDDLRVALGMPTGPNANKCPPPWLIAMQRYGPPPSYPNLKIPGLNAPIPEGCAFGYHAGGWGKPPVDEQGRPLYGDVFGTLNADNQPHIAEEEIDHTKWGELESESSEEEEEDEDEDEEEEEQKGEDETGLVTPAEGLITPSGFSSIPAGMETPDMIELRKRKIEAEMEGGETPALYTILPEKKSERVGVAMMGSTHIYDLAAAIPAAKVKVPGTTSVPSQGIEVALDPSELEMDTAAMAARYEQTMREQQSQLEKEDLSDMVAEHAARQKSKRKKMQQDSGKAPKKYKEFKF